MNAESAGILLPTTGISSTGTDHSQLPMYTRYFGFREEPFSNTADLRFFYTTPTYQKAHSTLLSGIREYKGFLLLTGEAGTGKTILLRRVMQDLAAAGHYVFFDSTSLTCATFDDLLYFICSELGLPIDLNGQAQKLHVFSSYLNSLVNKGGTGVLVVDEAQHLSDEVLRHLRLLTPVDMQNERLLLQVVLVGQLELEEKLNQPSLRAINQRIALRCRLERLTDDEVILFIQHRLRMVGCERNDLFAPEAMQRIIHYAKGIPRVVNIICDNALFAAYKKSQSTISAVIIDDVVANLHLRNETNKLTIASPTEPSGEAEPEAALPTPPHTVFARRSFRQSPEKETSELAADLVTFRPSTSLYVLALPALALLLVVGGVYSYWVKYGIPWLLQPTPLLVITYAEPSKAPNQVILVHENQKQRFAVEATSTDPTPLQYIWLLDGKEQGRGRSWSYQPQRVDRGKLKTIAVRITDSGNRVIERSWRIRVHPVGRLSEEASVRQRDKLGW